MRRFLVGATDATGATGVIDKFWILLLAFAKETRNDLRRLRPDILARYYLRQSEFDAWLKAVEDARRK